MNPVQFPAQLAKIETRVDGSIKLSIETQELNGQDMAALFGYRNLMGYVTFTPNAETKVEVPEINADTDMGKSPGQRLRDVLYVLYEQSGKSKYDTFTQFYTVSMEKIINQVKDKLE